MQVLETVAAGTHTPTTLMPADTFEPLRNLVASCVSRPPAERPTFDQVQVALDELRDSLSEAERLWLDEPHGHPVYEGAGVVL